MSRSIRILALMSLIATLSLSIGCASAPAEKMAEASTEDDESTTDENMSDDAKVEKTSTAPAEGDGDVFGGGGPKIEDDTSAFAADSEAFKKKEPVKKEPVVLDVEPELILNKPIVKGEIDKAKVENTIEKKRGAINACFKPMIEAKQGGSVFISFEIKPAGTVAKSKALSKTITDAGIKTCLTGVMDKLVFPGRKTVDKVTVQVPMLLSAP